MYSGFIPFACKFLKNLTACHYLLQTTSLNIKSIEYQQIFIVESISFLI